MPWILDMQKKLKGKRKTIRGNLIHLKHEELFSYTPFLNTMNNLGFNATRDLTRDDDLALHFDNPTLLKEVSSINFWSYHRVEIIVGGVVLLILLLICAVVLFRRFCSKSTTENADSSNKFLKESKKFNNHYNIRDKII